MDIKSKTQGINPNVSARNMHELIQDTGNIYETLNILSRRATQLNSDIRIELQQKLDEFAVTSDAIEEIHENKEQIEISKFYERMPNPTIIATNEMFNNELIVENANNKKSDEDMEY